ncbi:hypothetical protein GGX14DRAFT_478330, partial [Mycena pura]
MYSDHDSPTNMASRSMEMTPQQFNGNDTVTTGNPSSSTPATRGYNLLERFTSPASAVVFGGLFRLLIALCAVLSPLIWELPTMTSRVVAALRALIIISVFVTKAKEIRHGAMTYSLVGLVVLPSLFLAPYALAVMTSDIATQAATMTATGLPLTVYLLIALAKLGWLILLGAFLSSLSFFTAATYQNELGDLGLAGQLLLRVRRRTFFFE